MTGWEVTTRADPAARQIADRHYSRQKIGTPQFVQPGRCIVLIDRSLPAVWVTSWPLFVRHDWPGAWNNSLFRNEGHGQRASDLIRSAVAATRAFWQPPANGIISFVNPERVQGVVVRSRRIYGWAYWRAGWRHVGYTRTGLWVWQQMPDFMPPPAPASRTQGRLFA